MRNLAYFPIQSCVLGALIMVLECKGRRGTLFAHALITTIVTYLSFFSIRFLIRTVFIIAWTNSFPLRHWHSAAMNRVPSSTTVMHGNVIDVSQMYL